MSVDWDGYDVYQPGPGKPPREQSRSEARREFEKLMADKDGRIDELRRLLAADGVQLAETDAGLRDLQLWLAREIEPSPEDPGAPRNLWFSVLNDVALFLGDVMIKRAPGLEWRLFERGGKRNTAFHQPVIMGFDVPSPDYNVDLRGALSTYAHRVVAGISEGDEDLFVRMVHWAERRGPEGDGRPE
jgi:hypothetical protein